MPLLEGGVKASQSPAAGQQASRRSSQQYSELARSAIMSSIPFEQPIPPENHVADRPMPPPKTLSGRTLPLPSSQKPVAQIHNGAALTDTPLPSAPTSPQIGARPSVSGTSTPSKLRATTLDIPGLTRSKVSPDGRIAGRDVGAKLIIVMVGLPARGKSYIVKKVARYLNWLQHPTKIFNVGDRRRVAAGGFSKTISQPTADTVLRESVRKISVTTGAPPPVFDHGDLLPPPALAPNSVLVETMNGSAISSHLSMKLHNHDLAMSNSGATLLPAPQRIDQSAKFFDPDNKAAFLLREQVAHDTLDDLLDYVLEHGGSVGILDATNHTRQRRTSLMKHIRERDPNINVLFLESKCEDQQLLEANMRLKLSGPDYKNMDPVAALNDFQARVEQYGRCYQGLGEHEEACGMSYCSMIDVGRKMISYQVQGFLSVQTITYLMNFNLTPRQIWLTRHGESMDNLNGKIGGDSSLSPAGHKYAKALAKFMAEQRTVWDQYQIERQATTHFPPRPGDTTPPNPEYAGQTCSDHRNFCVWTSMLERSVQTSKFFNDEEYDLKQMRMLDELNAGYMEGLTYQEIQARFEKEYELRKQDKLGYRYPGPGGEGYLDVINRLRKVILEIERMNDHVLIIGHRSIVRVLLAYFIGLKQEDISDLDVPLGFVYMLEPVRFNYIALTCAPLIRMLSVPTA